MNKVIFIGNLTRAPETRVTQSGKTVCAFGLAVQRIRKVEGQPEADFFNVSAFGTLGERCAQYLDKGRKVCVVGSIQLRTYDAQDGTKRMSADVIAENVEFLTPRDEHSAPPPVPGANNAPGGFSPQNAGFTQVDEDELPF